LKYESKDVAINQNLFDSINNILYNSIEHTKAITHVKEDKDDIIKNQDDKNEDNNNAEMKIQIM